MLTYLRRSARRRDKHLDHARRSASVPLSPIHLFALVLSHSTMSTRTVKRLKSEKFSDVETFSTTLSAQNIVKYTLAKPTASKQLASISAARNIDQKAPLRILAPGALSFRDLAYMSQVAQMQKPP